MARNDRKRPPAEPLASTMTADRSDYMAYLLRLWRSETDGEAAWRASIESPRTGEKRGFASLDQLFEFLREQTTGPPVDLVDQARGADSRETESAQGSIG